MVKRQIHRLWSNYTIATIYTNITIEISIYYAIAMGRILVLFLILSLWSNRSFSDGPELGETGKKPFSNQDIFLRIL